MMAPDRDTARIERQDDQQAILAERAYWQQRYPEPPRMREGRLLDHMASCQHYAQSYARCGQHDIVRLWQRSLARALRRLAGTPV